VYRLSPLQYQVLVVHLYFVVTTSISASMRNASCSFDFDIVDGLATWADLGVRGVHYA
jgi:hypothetical protein